MQEVHVGRGAARGALEVFPVWGEGDVERDYSTSSTAAIVSEKVNPEVATLMVANTGDRPLLLLEGQVLEGGWQNRMVAQSIVVAARDEIPVGVVCVEAGRWSGRRSQTDTHRRAAPRVRAGLRSGGDRQREVWNRVSEYETRYGPNATSSFSTHADRAVDDVSRLTQGLRPFPAQIGVVIAIGGQPLSAELFDSPLTLAEQYQSIVTAAAMDAVGRPVEATPSRRVHRFIDHATRVRLHRTTAAGAGAAYAGETEMASVSVLRWRDRDVHTSLLNPRHELVEVGSR